VNQLIKENTMNPLRRLSSMLLVLLIAAVLLAACSSSTPESTEVPSELVELTKIKVASQPFLTFLPLYMAVEEGYFAEQGLDVELITMMVNQEVLPALSSGQVDVASGLLSSGLLNAIARGAEFKIVADKGYIDPEKCDNYAMVARKDLVESGALQMAADLRGHTINTVPATMLEFYVAKLLESGGLTLQDIEISEVPVPAQPEAFEQKTLAVTTNSEPWITRFKRAGHRQILTPPSQLLPGAHAALILYGPTMLGDHRDLGERFMVAYLKAVRQYSEGATPSNLEFAAAFTKLDAELLADICWPPIRVSGEVNVQPILDFQQWTLDTGYLDAAVSEDEFLDRSFVEHANQVLDGK
jgi:NitT/TauT family transport system substrate-binding protein